jgi:hypothetical protein
MDRVYAIRRRERHRQESSDARLRAADERLQAGGIVAPPTRAVETDAVVRRAGGGKVLLVGGFPGPGAAGTADPFETLYRPGKPGPYAAWLTEHDNRPTPAELAAEEHDNAVADAMRSLASTTPMLRGSDGSLRPLQVALEREPDLAPIVAELQARIEQSRAAKETAKEAATREAEREREHAQRTADRDARQAELARDAQMELRFRTAEDAAERALRMPPLRDLL